MQSALDQFRISIGRVRNLIVLHNSLKAQATSTFGSFGFANRTPIKDLWLVGDSTHPGEGTAGVSYSALTVVRQIEAQKL